MQLHLLDATYELFRAHFGRPPHADAKGQPVGATLGVVESVLLPLARRRRHAPRVRDGPRHRVVAEQALRGYKSSVGVPPELLAQFQLAEDALRAIGVVVWPMVEFEADDALGAAAARWVDARASSGS